MPRDAKRAARAGARALGSEECVRHSVPRSLAPSGGRRAVGVAPENATCLEGSLCQLVVLEVFAAFGTARFESAAPSVKPGIREDRFVRYAERTHKSPRERRPRRRPFSAPKNRKPGNVRKRVPGPLARFPCRPIPCGRRRCRNACPGNDISSPAKLSNYTMSVSKYLRKTSEENSVLSVDAVDQVDEVGRRGCGGCSLNPDSREHHRFLANHLSCRALFPVKCPAAESDTENT